MESVKINLFMLYLLRSYIPPKNLLQEYSLIEVAVKESIGGRSLPGEEVSTEDYHFFKGDQTNFEL